MAQQVLSTVPAPADFDLAAELSFCVSVNLKYERLFYVEADTTLQPQVSLESRLIQIIITGLDETFFDQSLVFNTICTPRPGTQSG